MNKPLLLATPVKPTTLFQSWLKAYLNSGFQGGFMPLGPADCFLFALYFSCYSQFYCILCFTLNSCFIKLTCQKAGFCYFLFKRLWTKKLGLNSGKSYVHALCTANTFWILLIPDFPIQEAQRCMFRNCHCFSYLHQGNSICLVDGWQALFLVLFWKFVL